FTLEVSQITLSGINHRIAHGHRTGRCTGNHKAFLKISFLNNFEKLGSTKYGSEAQLIATAEHDTIAAFSTINILRVPCIIAVAYVQMLHMGTTNLVECIQIVLSHFFGNTACSSYDDDVLVRPTDFLHHTL